MCGIVVTWARGRRRRPAGGGLRQARVPRLRLGRRGGHRRRRQMQVVRCRGKLAELEDDAGAGAAAGHASASATPAGRRTAARGENAHPHKSGRSRWCTTASSRTTWRCGRGSRRRGASSRPRPTPRSSPTSSTRRCRRARRRWSRRCGGRSSRCSGAYALVVISRQAPGADRRRQERLAAGASASARARTSSPPTCPRSSSTPAR